MCYYTDIDPIGMEDIKKRCSYCGRETDEDYCSPQCKKEDNE